MDIAASHYPALYAGYGAAVGATVLLSLFVAPRANPKDGGASANPARALWPAVGMPAFARPWLEFLLALLSVGAVLAVGQLYMRGIRLPTDGRLGWLMESINQIVIFSPVLVVAALRRHSLSTFFVTLDRAWLRLLIGISLGLVAVVAYSLTRFGVQGLGQVLDSMATLGSVPHVVQVLMEDLVIACLLVRLGSAVGSLRVAGLIVIVLFVAAHVPALIAGGKFDGAILLDRFADVGVGAIVLGGLLRTRDLLWLWPLHSLMDLTQFVPTM